MRRRRKKQSNTLLLIFFFIFVFSSGILLNYLVNQLTAELEDEDDTDDSDNTSTIRTQTYTYNIPFTIASNYQYNDSTIEFESGIAQLIGSSISADCSFYASYDENINGTSGLGSLEGTATGNVNIENQMLNLTDGSNQYLDYNATLNADHQQTGTFRLTWIPQYSGGGSNQNILSISEDESNGNNRISIYHTGGLLFIFMANSTGGTIISFADTLTVVSDTRYIIEFNWDITTGSSKLFINGTLFGNEFTNTGIRSSDITLMRLGANIYNTGNPDFYIDDLYIFSTVQHTENYNVSELSDSYSTNNDSITVITPFTTTSLYAWDSFSVSDTILENDAIKYVLSYNNGSTWLYYNNGWTLSTGMYNQASTESIINTYIHDFPISHNSLKVRCFLHSYNGSTTPIIDNIAITYRRRI